MNNQPRSNAELVAAIEAMQKELVKGKVHQMMLHYPTLIEACKELLTLRINRDSYGK